MAFASFAANIGLGCLTTMLTNRVSLMALLGSLTGSTVSLLWRSRTKGSRSLDLFKSS